MKDADGKVVTLQVSVGKEDERDIETFIADLRELLGDEVKRVTIFNEYYLINGRPVKTDGTDLLTQERVFTPEEPEAEDTDSGEEATEPEPAPEPEPEYGNDELDDQALADADDAEGRLSEEDEAKQAAVRAAATKVGKDAGSRLSMKKD